MAGRPKKVIEEKQLVCLALATSVLPFCRALKPAEGDVHGNTRLKLGDTLLVLLCSFFNPLSGSQRLIEQLSQMKWAKDLLGVDRVCKSTLSDALARFD